MDNLVQGVILDRSSKRGLENLLVILYDIDEEKREFSDMGVEGPLVSDDDKVEPQPVDTTTAEPPNVTLGQAARPDARTWIDFPGDRLGSVLTDKQGRFSLTYSDDLFRLGEKERRPELVLIVLGADHTKGVSVIDRLLHYSYVPRNNAGRIESYIIHIDHATRSTPDLQSFFSRLISPTGREKRAAAKALRRRIPSQLLPSVLTGNPRYVSARATPDEVFTVTVRAIHDGVEWLRAAADTARSPVVRLTSEEVTELGATPDTTFTANLCDILQRRGIGADLGRVRNLISELRAHDPALLEPPASSTDDSRDDSTDDTPIVTDTAEAADFIAGRVLGQIATLPALSRERSRGIIDDLRTIKDRINELEMSAGPANVTAFRDFHFLQVAFRDTWTAALDGVLEDNVAELYDTVNQLNEDYGDPFTNPDTLNSLTEFEDFIESIDADLMDEDLRVDSIPDDIQGAYSGRLTLEQWNSLTTAGQNRIINGVNDIQSDSFLTGAERDWQLSELLREVMSNSSYRTPIGRLQRLVLDIDARLGTPYSFRYYKEYSINYGILVNYRQEWRPQHYQVGRLVSTLPLAPGESRELKVAHKVKLSRAEKEIRKSLAESSIESSSSVKSELDVLAKLSTDTNFKMTAAGSFSLGIGSIESSNEFSHNQKAESQRQHKQIAEATRKAAEQVREEREVSIEQTTETELETQSTQKIHNPNNEVTVTYLMYELERRYCVSQALNRVTPVIMVALDMPSPHEITEGWILEYAWILRRVLLDDHFSDAIDWLEDGRQSEAVDIAVKRATYERELATLRNIERDLDLVLSERRSMRDEIINLEERKARYEAGEDAADDVRDFFLSGGLSLFFGGGPDQGELLQAGIDSVKARLKYVDEATEQLTSQQRAAKRESREAGRIYSQALKELAQRDTAIKQLQLHIRQNIFHYMHAIWETRHPDELFFQLAEQEVPHLGGATISCEFVPTTAAPTIPGMTVPGSTYEVRCAPPALPDLSTPGALDAIKVPLGKIADVDRLMGFKGNYAIFPLKDCSQLTDYMVREFVDDFLGVRDPATALGISAAELVEYARQAIQSEALTPAQVRALKRVVEEAISSPHYNVEDVILPTGQIYMEALKGEQALLEDFKLAHRGMDVLKVQEEVRSERLDNLRRAGRMSQSPPDYTDPDVDKSISVDGSSSLLIDTD